MMGLRYERGSAGFDRLEEVLRLRGAVWVQVAVLDEVFNG